MSDNIHIKNCEKLTKWIKNSTKFFLLVKKLLNVKNATKKLKREIFDLEQIELESAESVLKECYQLLKRSRVNPESAAECVPQVIEKGNIATHIIRELMKKTNFYSPQTNFGFKEVLEELEEATDKFKEIAE